MKPSPPVIKIMVASLSSVVLIVSVTDDQRSYDRGMSIDSGPGPVVSRRLGYLFTHAQIGMEKLGSAALAPFGIDARELGILLVIASHEPGSQQQAAQRLGNDPTLVGGRLGALAGTGL